jgi:hypothetical protein
MSGFVYPTFCMHYDVMMVAVNNYVGDCNRPVSCLKHSFFYDKAARLDLPEEHPACGSLSAVCLEGTALEPKSFTP